MICNVTIKGIGIIDEEIKKSLNAVGYFNLDTSEASNSYTIRYKGLRITTNGNRLTIKNSLHKYYHTNNTGLFTYSECKATIEDLSAILKVNLWECEITRFEFGINVPVSLRPKLYLDSMQGFKSKSIYDLDSSDRRNTIFYKTGDYKLKLYNKTKEAGIRENLLRFEIERLKPAHYLKGMRLVKDVISKESFLKLGAELLNKFSKIQFEKPLPNNLGFNDFLITQYIEKAGLIKGLTTIESKFGKRKKNEVNCKLVKFTANTPFTNLYQTELLENLKTQIKLSQN